MKEPKITKGPWQIKPEECGKDYIRIRGTVLGGRYKIANVITPVYAGAPDSEAEETRANARLICQSPELAKALLNLVIIAQDSKSQEMQQAVNYAWSILRSAGWVKW